ELNHGVLAAVVHPHVVIFVHGDARAFAEMPSRWKLRPVLDDLVGKRRARFQLSPATRSRNGEHGSYEKTHSHRYPPVLFMLRRRWRDRRRQTTKKSAAPCHHLQFDS